MKPSNQTKPNHFILHVVANDLNSNRPPDKIAKIIFTLVSELKSNRKQKIEKDLIFLGAV